MILRGPSSIITSEQLAEAQAIGGHPSPKWSPGSCWANEGMYLYRTVREMRPEVIVEVGRWEGCSATHLALGCKHNGHGRLYSIDINAGAGSKIPAESQNWITFLDVDVFKHDWVRETGDLPIDLLLEDGAHSAGFTKHVLQSFPARRVIVHDFFHPGVPEVRNDCLSVFGQPHETFFESPSDCGYAIYKFDR